MGAFKEKSLLVKKMRYVTEKTCRICSATFMGGGRAWYCPVCREERTRERDKEHKRRKRLGLSRRVGDTMVCIDCKEIYQYYIGASERCRECAKKHLKKIDNEASMKWKQENKEKYLEAKRDFDKKRRKECYPPTGQKYIFFEKSSRMYRLKIKGHHVGYFKTINEAINKRNSMQEWKDCIEEMKEKWLGREITHNDNKYTVIDVNEDGIIVANPESREYEKRFCFKKEWIIVKEKGQP